MTQTVRHYGFSQVPRQVLRGEKYKKKLSLADKGLYACIKDICGETGECFYSLRNLAEEIGTSPATLSRLIPVLRDAKLIYAEKKARSNSENKHETWHIRIVDIWKENDDLYKSQECCNMKQSSISDRNNVTNASTSVSQNEKIVSESGQDCFNLLARIITSNDNLNEEENKVTSAEENFANRNIVPNGTDLLQSLFDLVSSQAKQIAEIQSQLTQLSSKQTLSGDTHAQSNPSDYHGTTVLSHNTAYAEINGNDNNNNAVCDTSSISQHQSPVTPYAQQEVTHVPNTPSPTTSTQPTTITPSDLRDNPSTGIVDSGSHAHSHEDKQDVEQQSIQDNASNRIAKGTINEKQEKENVEAVAIRDEEEKKKGIGDYTEVELKKLSEFELMMLLSSKQKEILARWRSLLKAPVKLEGKLARALFDLEPYDPSAETLNNIRRYCYVIDRSSENFPKGYYKTRGVKLWDVVEHYADWKQTQELSEQPKQEESKPYKTLSLAEQHRRMLEEYSKPSAMAKVK